MAGVGSPRMAARGATDYLYTATQTPPVCQDQEASPPRAPEAQVFCTPFCAMFP